MTTSLWYDRGGGTKKPMEIYYKKVNQEFINDQVFSNLVAFKLC